MEGSPPTKCVKKRVRMPCDPSRPPNTLVDDHVLAGEASHAAVAGHGDGGHRKRNGMDGGMGASAMTAGMGWDASLVSLTVRMLVSERIMTQNGSMAADSSGM